MPAEQPRRATEVRGELVEAGTRLIAAEGIEGVNTNSVARAAGVGVGTFYRHFEDKHALHRACVLRGYESLQARLTEVAREHTDRDIADQVRAQVQTTVDFAEGNPAQFRVSFGAGQAAARGKPAMSFSTRAVERRLVALQDAGELHPGLAPEAAARGFAGMLNASVLWWLESPGRVERDRLVSTLVLLHPAVAARVRP